MKMISNSVYRSKAYENTLQILGGPGSKMFTTLRDALGFAAALGYKEGRRWKLDSKAGREDIQSSVYYDNNAVDLIFAIALAESKSAEILKKSNEKECIEIFEEYANGGLALLTEWMDQYADVDVEVAVWRGLKKINFVPEQETGSDEPTKSIEF
jgi:dnd system-associated protein 4